MNKRYELAQNPNNRKWYVIGFAGFNRQGRRQFVPISGPWGSKELANQSMHHQLNADHAAIAELKTV